MTDDPTRDTNQSVHVARNRASWDGYSDEYQERHGAQLADSGGAAWGTYQIPQEELGVLGDVSGLDVLEFGCGAAQWSIALAKRGARPVGLDFSAVQLDHARRLMAQAGVDFPLVEASAEDVPLPDASFDVVFCDHGAMSWADPYRPVPEVARLLRPGGLFVFNMSSVLIDVCWNHATDDPEPSFQRDYFGLHRLVYDEGITYNLPYGEWIRLFRRHGLVVEDLIELQPAA